MRSITFTMTTILMSLLLGYVSMTAQFRQITFQVERLSVTSCSISVNEINNGSLTSCTVQLSLVNFDITRGPEILIFTQATLTSQRPRHTVFVPRGRVFRLDAVDIQPRIFPVVCRVNGAYNFDTYAHLPAQELIPFLSDSRLSPNKIPPLPFTLGNNNFSDSTLIVIYGSSRYSKRLRISQIADSLIAWLRTQTTALQEVWISDPFSTYDCLDSDYYGIFSQSIFIRLHLPDTNVLKAFRQNFRDFGDFISVAPFSMDDMRRIIQIQSSIEQIQTVSPFQFYQYRYYNFSTTTSVRSTQQESGLVVRMSPQPLSGMGMLTLATQRPLIADIRVVNMLGQTVAVLAERRLFSIGETVIPCSVEALSSGVYAVQVVSGGRVVHTQSVVVTR
jgi:hypothetical protein